jgi:hypothetical protein
MGTVLCRVVVPAWVLPGAITKLVTRDPFLLPTNIVKATKTLAGIVSPQNPEMVLDLVMRSLAGLELLAVVLMVLVARASRGVAIFMLSVFCLILIGEMVVGAASCGCFGSLPIKPWQMLIADGALLAGVLLLKPASDQWLASARRGPVLASVIVAAVAGFGFSFGTPPRDIGGGDGVTPPTNNPPVTPTASGCPPLPTRGTPQPLYFPNYDTWVGLCWTQVPLAQFAGPLPPDFNEGTWYVIFYRKNCDHCHELLERFFTGPLKIRTLAIATPERSGFPALIDQLPMPCTECVLRELPIGPDYAMQSPVLVRVKDGVVECAAEGVDAEAPLPECLLPEEDESNTESTEARRD